MVFAAQKEMGRLQDLLNKLFGKDMDEDETFEVLQQLLVPEQPARGLQVQARGFLVMNDDGTPKLNKKGNKIVNTTFEPLENTGESLAANRALIDALPRYATKAAPTPTPVAVAAPTSQTVAAPTPVAVAAPTPAPLANMPWLGIK